MTLLRETATLKKQPGGLFLIQIITPGTGSSGDYSAETIAEAGRNRVFPAGTHMYLDHATEAQDWERPEGSLRDLVGVLAEDAHIDEDGGLSAPARIYSHWKSVLEEMKDHIGVSIRAAGEVIEEGGKRIITRITEARSVDFVTKAGRGGRILEILESARLTEATAEETRRLIQAAVKAEHGADTTWVWLRDHDDTKVWFDVETEDANVTYEQAYTLDNVTVTLTGTPIEVVPTTVYTPKTNPAPAGKEPQKESDKKEKATMAVTSTDTSRVEEADTELDKLRKENAALKAEIAELKKAKAKEARRTEVADVVEEAFENIDAPAMKELLIDRLAESDATGDELIKEASTYAEDFKTAVSGSGQVRGLGESRPVLAEADDTPLTYGDIAAVKGA